MEPFTCKQDLKIATGQGRTALYAAAIAMHYILYNKIYFKYKILTFS